MFWLLRRSRSRKNTAGRIRGEDLVIQCTVDAVVVVVESPADNHPRSVLQAQEQLALEQLVAELAVE